MRKLMGVVLMMAGGAALAEYPSAAKQMKMSQDLTMEQVRDLLGEPDEVSGGTGSRIWAYISPHHIFQVNFAFGTVGYAEDLLLPNGKANPRARPIRRWFPETWMNF